LRGDAAEAVEGGADPWGGGEWGVREGVGGDVQAVALARAEGAVVEPVRVQGFLAEGGVDEGWHFGFSFFGGERVGRG